MFKTAALLALLGLAALLLYAASRPDDFTCQRTVRILAPAERIHPRIADLHQFNAWNPYNQKDPAIQVRYRGPASGPGAAFDFKGNSQAGQGSIELTGVTVPTEVTMTLRMIEPMAATHAVVFTLVPQGGATDVTWAMRGRSPFIAKLAGVFLNMDHLIGRDFEAGLATLKAQAEAASPTSP